MAKTFTSKSRKKSMIEKLVALCLYATLTRA